MATDHGETEVATIKHHHFKGLARITLCALSFDLSFKSGHREPSVEIVSDLELAFRAEGCLRLDDENYVDCVVDDSVLEAAVLASPIDRLALPGKGIAVPHLDIERVDCLNGLHRILAAERFLDEGDRWWIVRMYSKDLPPEIRRQLIEQYSRSRPFTGGEIFRRIQLYHHNGNEQAEKVWWTRLPLVQRRRIKRLLRSAQLVNAFNDLLDLPGLWYAIPTGRIHEVLAMRLDNEITNYLRHVNAVWRQILGNVSPATVDKATVEGLEGMAPATSATDKNIINELTFSETIFSTVHDQAARETLLDNIGNIACVIPSFRILFANLLSYLQPPCMALKKLSGASRRQSFRRALGDAYSRTPRLVIEHHEMVRLYDPSSFEDDERLGYLQLWLYALRHFPELTGISPARALGKNQVPVGKPSAACWTQFAKLAIDLGFRTRLALQLRNEDVNQMLDDRILHNEPLETGDTNLGGAVQTDPATSKDRVEQHQRYGMCPLSSHLSDRNLLYLPTLYGEREKIHDEVNSFFLKRDMFQNFFGHQLATPWEAAVVQEDTSSDYDELAFLSSYQSTTSMDISEEGRHVERHDTELAPDRSIIEQDDHIFSLELFNGGSPSTIDLLNRVFDLRDCFPKNPDSFTLAHVEEQPDKRWICYHTRVENVEIPDLLQQIMSAEYIIYFGVPGSLKVVVWRQLDYLIGAWEMFRHCFLIPHNIVVTAEGRKRKRNRENE